MHVVIGVLTALAGLIYAFVALQRAGVRLSSLDPFAWYRRYQWRKKYGGKPIYNLRTPLDVAAVLLLGTVKCEGEISAEQKKEIMSIFETDFHQSADEAADLLLASAHLIRNETYLVDNLPKILETSAREFTERQVQSLLSLMRRVSALEGAPNQEQEKLIAETEKYFSARARRRTAW